MNGIQLKYPPGSEWLYFRIYGGAHALEAWLSGPFRDLLSEWRQSGCVDLFYFLHYLDPDYHLRLRLHLSDPLQSGLLLHQVQLTCSDLIEEELMWKIELGTYEPEYDRYGYERFFLIEKWFEQDSDYWLHNISNRVGEDKPDIWQTAIRSVDQLMNDFGIHNDGKIHIINRLRDSSFLTYQMSKDMRLQLDSKYRKVKNELVQLMSGSDHSTDESLEKRTAGSQGIITQIQNSFSDQAALISSTLLPDLIHMSLNRAFRTRHRLQELVIYDFLGKYYESSRAREVKKSAI